MATGLTLGPSTTDRPSVKNLDTPKRDSLTINRNKQLLH